MSSENYKKLLSKADIEPLLQRSDGLAWQAVTVNYLLIILAFSLPVLWFNPLSVLICLILLGNRQLGLGILMHDCAHYAFFRSKALNRWAGHWLFAAPILAQFDGYRQYHLRHHAKAGTDQDPDYPNYRPYPIRRRSLLRKIMRDMMGLTGLKNLAAIFLMHAGYISFDMSYKATSQGERPGTGAVLSNLIRNLYRSVLVHLVLFLLLWLAGHPGLYLLWWVAFLTTFQLFSRIRNAAEHANVPDLLNKDPRLHARTTMARWWEKLTVAPNHVNFHLEHHWIATVPPYRLASFHRLLSERGLLGPAEVLSDYGAVLRQMTAER